MNLAARIFVGVSLILSTYAVISASLLWPTFYFPAACVLAVAIYLLRPFLPARSPRIFGDAAFFSIIAIYILACLNSVFSASFIRYYNFYDWTWWTKPQTIEFVAGAIFAPIGLLLSLVLNFFEPQRSSFWRGSIATIVAAFILYGPEGIWIRYHGHRLASGDLEAIKSSLNSLAKSPSGVRRFGTVVCDNLFLRDIHDEYFMYDGTEFLPDKGASKIVKELDSRFGAEAPSVLEYAQSTFGKKILLRCSNYKNPSH